MVALRAACDGEPGVVLTLLISRLFRLSVAAVVPVGSLPSSVSGLQPLGSRPDLLRTRLCTDGAARCPARGGAALPGQPPRSGEPCGAGRSLSCPTKQRDASGFPATSRR